MDPCPRDLAFLVRVGHTIAVPELDAVARAVCTFTIVSETMRSGPSVSRSPPRACTTRRDRVIFAPAVVVPDDLPQLFLLVVRKGVERDVGLLVEVDVCGDTDGRCSSASSDLHRVAQLPAVVGVRRGRRDAKLWSLAYGYAFTLRVDGREDVHLAETAPGVTVERCRRRSGDRRR